MRIALTNRRTDRALSSATNPAQHSIITSWRAEVDADRCPMDCGWEGGACPRTAGTRFPERVDGAEAVRVPIIQRCPQNGEDNDAFYNYRDGFGMRRL